MLNFKSITLDLYNQEVKVTLKPNTECYHRHGNYLTGILTGRIWGDSLDEDGNSNVIGFTIKTSMEDIDVNCSEVESIERI